MRNPDKKNKKVKSLQLERKPPSRSRSRNNNKDTQDFDVDLQRDSVEDLAQGIFYGAEIAIKEARDHKCNVSEAELFLKKGHEQFKLGNFDYADNYCQLAIKAAKDAIKKKRAESLFHEIAKIISDNSALYSNIDSIESSYRTAEAEFDSGNYDTAIYYLMAIKNDSIDIIFDNIINDTENKLQNLAEIIRNYKRKKLDISKPSEILAGANRAFDSGDYATANELADEALQLLNSLIMPELKEKATEIMEKVKKLKNSETIDRDSLKEAEPFFNDLETAFIEGRFEYLLTQEKELSEIAERIIKIGKLTEYQMLDERLKALENQINESKNLGINVKEAKEALSNARKSLEAKNFEISKEWMEKTQELNNRNKNEYMQKKVESIIFSAQSLINEISETGADVSDAENKLGSSKKLLSQKKFDESRKLAEQTIIVSKETLLGHVSNRAETMMEKNKKIISELKSRNIDSSKLESVFKAGKEKFDAKDYTGAIELFKSLEDSSMGLLNQMSSQQVMGQLKIFEEKINEAREFDIPVDNFVNILEDVKIKLESGSFQEAEHVISKSLEDLNNKLKDLSLRKKLNEILSDIETIRSLGAGVKRLEALRERSIGALNQGNIINAEDSINKLYVATKKNLKETYSLQVGKQLRNLENKLKALKDRDKEIPEVEIIYNDAVEALRNRDYEAALNLVTKGDDLIDELLQEDKTLKFNKDLDALLVKVDEAKIAGLDVERIEDIIRSAQSKIRDKYFTEAKDLIRKGEKDLISIHESKKVTDLLHEIETEMKEVKTLGINVTKLENAYKQAIKSADRNDIRRALDIARDISSILTMIKKDQLRSSAQEIFKKVEAELRKLHEQNIRIEGTIDLFERAKEAMNRNEFEECIQFCRKLEDTIKKKEKAYLVENIERKLEVFRFELSQAANQGMDVTQFNKSLGDVTSLLEEGKPNPARDVLKLAQRNFNKVKEEMKAGGVAAGPGEITKPPETPHNSNIEAPAIPSTSTALSQDIPVIDSVSVEKDASNDKASPDIKDVMDESKKKFGSLGNIGLKTLEKMSAKADTIMENDNQDDLGEIPGFSDDDFEGLPMDDSADDVLKPQTHGMKSPDFDKNDTEKIPQITEADVRPVFEANKAELKKLKSEEKAGLKINTSQFESLLNAAGIAINEQNYGTAKKFLDESSDLINDNLRDERMKFTLGRLKNDIDDLWSSGEKIGPAEATLKKAKKEFESGNFVKAEKSMEKLDELVRKFKEEKLKKELQERLKEADKKINAMKKLDIDKENLNEFDNKASDLKKLIKGNKLKEAGGLINELQTGMDQLESSYWEKMVTAEREEIEKLIKEISDKDEKAVNKQFTESLETSRKLFESKTFKKSLDLLLTTKNQLNTVLQKIIKEKEAEAKVKPETKDMQKAKSAFEKIVGKPMSDPNKKKAKKEADKVAEQKVEKPVPSKPETKEEPPKQPEKIEKAPTPPPQPATAEGVEPESYSRGLITDVVILLQKIGSEGGNIDEPNKLLQQAKEEFICKNYDNANKLALEAQEKLLQSKPEMFEDQARKDIQDLQNYFNDLKTIGVETEPLERNMKIIRADFQTKDYVKVRNATENLKNKAKRLKTEFLKVTLQPKIQDLIEKVAERKKSGAEVAEIESYLADAEGSITDEDYDGALQLYTKASQLVSDLPDEDESKKEEIENGLESLKKNLERCSGYKIEIGEVEQLITKIEDNLENKEYDIAESNLKQANDKIYQNLKVYSSQLLSRVELEIEDVALSGVETKASMDLLGKSKKFIESKEYHEAIKTLVTAERMAQDAGDSFMKIFEGLRRLSREMSLLPKDTDSYEELIKLRIETKQKLESKDYMNALTTLNRAIALLREINNN